MSAGRHRGLAALINIAAVARNLQSALVLQTNGRSRRTVRRTSLRRDDAVWERRRSATANRWAKADRSGDEPSEGLHRRQAWEERDVIVARSNVGAPASAERDRRAICGATGDPDKPRLGLLQPHLGLSAHTRGWLQCSAPARRSHMQRVSNGCTRQEKWVGPLLSDAWVECGEVLQRCTAAASSISVRAWWSTTLPWYVCAGRNWSVGIFAESPRPTSSVRHKPALVVGQGYEQSLLRHARPIT